MAADFPSRHDIVPWSGHQSSAFLERWRDPSALDIGFMRLTSSGGFARWVLAMKAGTWSLTQIAISGADRGIATWKLGATTLGTLDWYVGGGYNTVKTLAGFVVPTGGVFTLELSSPTKNPSASLFLVDSQHITLQRTGA